MDWVKLWKAVGGRKFVAFAVASVFLGLGWITPTIWVTAFSVYVGGNVLQKAIEPKAATWRGETDVD